MSALFPVVDNPRQVRTLYPQRWRLLCALKRQGSIVRNRQLRKLNLTSIAVQWKGAGMPMPAHTDAQGPSYWAIRHAAETLEAVDISAAYHTCAVYVGARLRRDAL